MNTKLATRGISLILLIAFLLCLFPTMPILVLAEEEAYSTSTCANISISAEALQQATTLNSAFNMGVNLEMSMISDEMWIDNGHWMAQSFANSGIKIMRWGYDAWVFDWENEEPLLDNYQGGNNTKDDEGSFGLREFLVFCKEYDIIPLVDIPIESYDHRTSSAETTGPASLEKVKRLALNMATYLNECGFDEVYFDMGNEPYSYVSCQYGGISAETYGSLFPSFYEIIKSVNPNYKLILVHQEGATSWNNAAEAAANGCYDGVDDHQYPRPNGWSNYYARNDDDIFSNGFGGTTPNDKIKIMGECNLPWPNFPAYSYTLGSAIALLNGFLDLANDDYYSSIIMWPSHWPTSATTANVGSASLPVGWFDTDAWYYDKDTSRLNGPAYAEMIAQKNVLDKKVTSTCDNEKVRTFVYTNEDNSILKVIVLNKESSDEMQINISLPSQYNAVNAMVLRGERDASTGSASECDTPTFESHLTGNVNLSTNEFTDSVTYGECVIVYTFFNEETGTLGAFDFTSPTDNNVVGTAHNFTWSASANATNYHLVISANSDLSEPEIDVYTSGITNYQPSEDLQPGVDYYCKVTAINSTGTLDNASGILQIETLPKRVFVNDDVTDSASSAYWTFSGTWLDQSYLGCLKGDDHVSSTAGSTATFTFNGIRACIYGVKGDWCGKIDVYVDNNLAETIDLYRENPVAQSTALPTQDLLFDTGLLSSGQHTVKIQVRSDKNAAVSGTSYIELDYAEVFTSELGIIEYHTEAPTIIDDLPESVELSLGDTLTLEVSCSNTNTDSVTYEWYRDDVLLGVTSSNSISLSNVTSEEAGEYYVRITRIVNGIAKTTRSQNCEVLIDTPITLSEFLEEAEETGFCYTFWGSDRTFDGTRIELGTDQDIERLKSSSGGTLLVRYRTSTESNQVLFAAGKDYTADSYGAILANNVSTVGLQRVDFPSGMYANLSNTTISNEWHTFAYSVDATSLSDVTGKTVTSFDGSSTTQYPNYASWFNANSNINDIQYISIGGVDGSLARSSNNSNFNGEIAFVAFVPRVLTQEEAANITAEEWDHEVYSAANVSIAESSDAVALDESVLTELSDLDEITVIVKYQTTSADIGSLVSISDPTKTNSHFHIYSYGNTVGYEFRNNDNPKYSATCGSVQSGEINTVAFKAEKNVGYKLFSNGILGSTLAKDSASYQFLSDLTSQTAAYLGQTERPSGINTYPFVGDIISIEVYDIPLSDEYLLYRTAETTIVDNRVFYSGDETESQFFRIPFLLVTEDDVLIAGADANYGSTGDSAENIDAAIRLKQSASAKDAMSGWGDASIPYSLHMQDYTDTSGYRQQSASFIDGVIVEDSTNDRIIMVIDAWAWNGGLFSYLNVNSSGQSNGGTMRTLPYGDGFCTINGQKYLMLSSQNITTSDSHGTDNINANTSRANFDYVADIYGGVNSDGRYNIYHLNGTPNEYSSAGNVDDSNLSLGELSAYSLSTDYELYQNGTLLEVFQRADDSTYTSTSVPMKVFYKDSELQLYNTSYLMQVYSDDNGVTWHTRGIISGMVKPENSTYFITGPGSSIQIENGSHAGRIVIPVYYSVGGVSKTAVIFSDDHGTSWSLGSSIPASVGLSEAAIVEMPNGSLKAFIRNTNTSGGKIITATSNDGGESWVDVASALGDSESGVNCQVSALAISTLIVDPEDAASSYPALLMASANSSSRTNGMLWVGLIKENGTYDDGTTKYTIDWAYSYELTGTSELFAYSSMTEFSNGKVGILYETSPDSTWSTGLQGMYYEEFTTSQLIGE